MSYSDLQLNQTISFNNLKSGVDEGYFVAKTTIPVSAKQITKTEANTYVYLNTSLPTYAAKASNQLVVRSNLQGLTNDYPYTIYSANYPLGFSTDGGTTWTPYAWTNPPLGQYVNIAGNQTRTHIAVTDRDLNKQIYISNNSGASFHTVSLSPDIYFYARSVSMSNDGQYIVVSGLDRNDIPLAPPYDNDYAYFRIAVSSDYGATFTNYTSPSSYRVGAVSGYSEYRISISGNGQYITALFNYDEPQGFPYNYWRPSTILFQSNNYGATFTASNLFNNALFQGIALSGTGQYQFVTGYWEKRFILAPPEIGIKGYISNDYGATWTEKLQDYNSNTGGTTYQGLNLTGISENGKSMVAATGYGIPVGVYQGNTVTDLTYASSDYGATFVRRVVQESTSLQNQTGMAVGQYPVIGVTDSYVAIFSFSNQLTYSVDGGTTQWFFKEMYGGGYASRVYNKALNLPELPYSYNLYYNTTIVLPTVTGFNTAVDACDLAYNSFVVYSDSSSVVVGMELYADIYGLIPIVAIPSTDPYSYYRINGNAVQFASDDYTINSVTPCASYITYYADEYECDGIDCTYVQSNVLVVLPSSFTPDYTKYYLLEAGGPRIFFLDTTTSGIGLILSTTNYNSCLEICGI